MAERAKELKTEKLRAGRADKAAAEEATVLERIAEMAQPDRGLAERFHAVVCFFQSGEKFKTRYCTIGFNDAAQLDEPNLWPTAFAVVKLTKADEKRLGDLVKRAAG